MRFTLQRNISIVYTTHGLTIHDTTTNTWKSWTTVVNRRLLSSISHKQSILFRYYLLCACLCYGMAWFDGNVAISLVLCDLIESETEDVSNKTVQKNDEFFRFSWTARSECFGKGLLIDPLKRIQKIFYILCHSQAGFYYVQLKHWPSMWYSMVEWSYYGVQWPIRWTYAQKNDQTISQLETIRSGQNKLMLRIVTEW